MQEISPRTRLAILHRFRNLYVLLTVLFSIPMIGAIAFYWNQPRSGNNGFPYPYSLPILFLASLLINAISFYFQRRYLRSLLLRLPREFRVITFTFRFYLYNLSVAIGLSILAFYPLLITLFFFWIYPIAFWFIPYHLAIGWIIGRDLQRNLSIQT
jgi:hypothetical protein